MTVHVLDQGADAPENAAAGDHLVRRTGGEDVEVGRVTQSGAEWLGSVPASTLPLDDLAKLDIAVRGVETALVERGG